MKKQDHYYWRLFATGLSFTLFGLGGLLLRFFLFPLMHLCSLSAEVRQRRARKVIHWSFKLFIWQMKSLGVLTYNSHQIQQQLNQPGQLIIANHPTLIDVVFLISFIEQTNCIVNHRLFTNPFTRGPLRCAGYIPNIEALSLIKTCSERLQAGDSLVIFPEGTRTPPNSEKTKLQRGAANIALAAGISPLGVKIKCQPATLSKGQKWYHIPLKRPHWEFSMASSITLPDEKSGPKAARALNIAIQASLFN